MDATKKCSKCKEEKPVGKFGKNKRNKDGMQSLCKLCERNAPYRRKAWADYVFNDLDLNGNDY